MHPFKCISSSLVPIWHHFGTKSEQEAVPEAAWTSSGSIFGRFGGGEKPSRSSYAAETTVFSQFWCSKTRQEDFHRVLGPPIMGIFGINCALDTQKVSPITTSGREPKIWWKSDRFWISSKEQNHWFYIGFTIVSAISAYRRTDSKITSFGANKTKIFEVFGGPRRTRIDWHCDF